jgi:hypothetical protein
MKRFRFQLESEDSLVLVNSRLDEDTLTLALDTGATNTIVDLSLLLIAGYELKDARRIIELETAKGPIEAYEFEVKRLTALSIVKSGFRVCAYDFLSNRIFAEIDGVLGLDFLREHILTLDFRNFEIIIE